MQILSYKTIDTDIGRLTMYALDDALVLLNLTEEPLKKDFEYIKKHFGEYEMGEPSGVLYQTQAELIEYFNGKRKTFSIKTKMNIPDFSKRVLIELLNIPYGETTTYSDIADKLNKKNAFRAVGNAVNKNPLPIIYPCHRVNARDGLSGFAWGTGIKRKLQELERNSILLKNTEIISQNELLNPELTGFIRSKLPKDKFKEIAQYAYENNIPISKPETAAFLRTLCAIKKPQYILEIGTAVGYSALVMADSCSNLKSLISIERDEVLYKKAVENTKDYSNIKIINSDALDEMPKLNQKFDLIFVDAAKGQYHKFFAYCKKLLNNEGIMIFDNVLYKGLIANLQTIKHKNRTMVKNLQSFIDESMKEESFEKTILPIGDGIMLFANK